MGFKIGAAFRLGSLLVGVNLLLATAAPAQVRVQRITNDKTIKMHVQISADGSTVAWNETASIPNVPGEEFSVVKAAATDGSWTREIYRSPKGARYTDPKFTAGGNKLHGPHATPGDDNNYCIYNDDPQLRLSADGSVLVMNMREIYPGGWCYGYGVADLKKNTLKYVPLVIPEGMGFHGTDHDNVQFCNNGATFGVSGDGRFIVYPFTCWGAGDYYNAFALAALDLESGKARRLMGYVSFGGDNAVKVDPQSPCFMSGSRMDIMGNTVAVIGKFLGGEESCFVTSLDKGEIKLLTKSDAWPRVVGEGRVALPSNGQWHLYDRGGGEPLHFACPVNGLWSWPFWDGAAGAVTRPFFARDTQELTLVRGDGGKKVILRPGEQGLAPDWKMGSWSLGDHNHLTPDGSAMVLEMISPDLKQMDLFLVTLKEKSKPAVAKEPGSTTKEPSAAKGSLEAFPEEQAAMDALARSETAENRRNLARIRYCRAVQLAEYGWRENKAEAVELAISYVESATRLAPEKAEYWFFLGRACWDVPENRKALLLAEDALKCAIKLKPDYVTARLLLGRIFMRQERYDRALTEFETAVSQDLSLAGSPLIDEMAAAYRADSQSERGEKFFRQLLPRVSAANRSRVTQWLKTEAAQ